MSEVFPDDSGLPFSAHSVDVFNGREVGPSHSENCPLGAFYHVLQDLSVKASKLDSNVVCQCTVYDTSEEADEDRGSSGNCFYMDLWNTLF